MRQGYDNTLEMDGGPIENGDMAQQEQPTLASEKVNVSIVRTDPFMEHLAIAGTICKAGCAASLLIFALGCHQRPQVSEVTPGGGTNAEPATKDIVKTNYASERFPILTNATKVGDNAKKTLMSIWRSPDSTPEERADAVNKLLSPETTIQSAEALLGDDGVLSHYFGTYFGSAEDTNAGGIDFWLLKYDTQRGLVALRFSRALGSTNQFRFERACAGKVKGSVLEK